MRQHSRSLSSTAGGADEYQPQQISRDEHDKQAARLPVAARLLLLATFHRTLLAVLTRLPICSHSHLWFDWRAKSTVACAVTGCDPAGWIASSSRQRNLHSSCSVHAPEYSRSFSATVTAAGQTLHFWRCKQHHVQAITRGPCESCVSPTESSELEQYCFMPSTLMVMHLPSEPCMHLGLPSVHTNQFAEGLCSTTHTGSLATVLHGRRRDYPDIESAAKELSPKHGSGRTVPVSRVCGGTRFALGSWRLRNDLEDCFCPFTGCWSGTPVLLYGRVRHNIRHRPRLALGEPISRRPTCHRVEVRATMSGRHSATRLPR
ncbi:hypothetical protein EJ02DRAFT_236608 [Clathrospora elynae]|uniref:Uncharacterized protein n=1 Tax=Clathrospora elynae TaxID=706981 RepID=A0A6A5SLB5_9PLEO|nr:hypothetical protein EJ02DRAFT_236608 [Clathrospora elynae]